MNIHCGISEWCTCITWGLGCMLPWMLIPLQQMPGHYCMLHTLPMC